MITIECKSKLDEELLAAELRRRSAVTEVLVANDKSDKLTAPEPVQKPATGKKLRPE